jgi:hypothetical protein
MDMLETCTHRIGLCLKPAETERLEALALELGAPNLSAAIRAAIPSVFIEPLSRGGRPIGFSPKRKTA